jgi:hypothetical protein
LTIFKIGHRKIQNRPLAMETGQYQGALAADAGIYQELISRIENGAANPEPGHAGQDRRRAWGSPARAIGRMNEAAN